MSLWTNLFQSSIIFMYIGLLTFLHQTQISLGQLTDYLPEDLCIIECGGRKHTLCKDNPLPKCDQYLRFNIFEIPTIGNGEMLKLLVNGHNGLRNRIALKGHVGNMVKVNWDDDLANMVIEYYKQCKLATDDPCTSFNPFNSDNDLDKMVLGSLEYKLKHTDSYKYIAQSRFRVESEFFPDHFIESALRSWYHEKAKPAFLNYRGHSVGYVHLESNFTHLMSPLAANVGCAIAQIDKYYELTCNYYPFYRLLEEVTTLFASGTPVSKCPPLFPFKDEFFEYLCGNGDDIETSFALRILPTASFYILIAIAQCAVILM